MWAIHNNEYDKLGTTIHMVEKKLDTGDYVYQKFLEIKNSMKIHHIRYHTTILAVVFYIHATWIEKKSTTQV